ncbi:protein OSCP1a isoform X3 [Halichoeres trimaculatus]|uniref:protein OSCP1a isoform X3 n=1 Tax=Halichoeres trimaculatus TaxID=147232 RepID=UPI003D9E6FCB
MTETQKCWPNSDRENNFSESFPKVSEMCTKTTKSSFHGCGNDYTLLLSRFELFWREMKPEVSLKRRSFLDSNKQVYTSLSEGEFQLLRQTLLIFLQDSHVRVSLFMKSKVQNPNGRFVLTASGPVPHGMEVPGLIRMFDEKGKEVKRSEFPTGGCYSSPIREGSFELHGDRVIRLGLNMYNVNHPEETHTSKASSVKTDDTPNLLAKEELNQLARLMGSMKAENTPKPEPVFRINLFTSDQEEEEEEARTAGGAGEPLFGVINIQAMQDEQVATQLAEIAGQFTEGEEQSDNPGSSSSKGDDLLAMMDHL